VLAGQTVSLVDRYADAAEPDLDVDEPDPLGAVLEA
jgi:hypothetical protein